MKFEELHNDKETNDGRNIQKVIISFIKQFYQYAKRNTNRYRTNFVDRIGSTKRSQGRTFRCSSNRTWAAKKGEFAKLKTLKDVKPGDKVFVLNSNRGYLKEPQIETLTVNKVGILYIYTDYDKYRKSNGEAVESSLDIKAFATLEEAETGLFMIKARQYYRNSIKVDDITYTQMKAIFDILGIDTEEVLK
jgi:hypothetical protein